MRGVVSRSHMGDWGRASSLSQSPCRKNSSVILSVHWRWEVQGLPGWEMSAVCSSRHMTLERCSSDNWVTLWQGVVEWASRYIKVDKALNKDW